jgi:hypothetical protein
MGDDPRIELFADKVKFSGPRVDGSWVVSFEMGDDMKMNIAKLLAIPDQTMVKVTVELPKEDSWITETPVLL